MISKGDEEETISRFLVVGISGVMERYKYNPRNGYDKATVLMTSERARLKFLLNGFHVILFLHLNLV